MIKIRGMGNEVTECDHLDCVSSDLITIPHPHTPCNRCGDEDDNWLCLKCKVVLCGRYKNEHMLDHYKQTDHSLVLRIRFGETNALVWCYTCHSYLAHSTVSPFLPADMNDCAIKCEAEPETNDSEDDEVLWEGHMITKSYAGILSKIKEAHPETFEHLSSFRTPIICRLGLSTLAEFYGRFASEKVVDMTSSNIAFFEDVFSDLEVMRFNLGWLRERVVDLKEIQSKNDLFEEYKESARRVEAKEKELEELKKECSTKALSLSPRIGFLGEKILTWCAADDLL